MRSPFDDATLIEDQNLIGAADGAQPMRHDKTRARGEQAVERVLQPAFGDGVDGTGGLVENENARVGEERAGKADQLTLAEGETGAAFADLRREALR